MRLRIGFLGLGTMGAPLANNLRKAGHLVTVWNRTAEKADALVKKGATAAQTPRECAAGRDLVFTCLGDEAALEAALGGPDGALAGLGPGAVLVDASTSGVRTARSLQARVAERGAAFLAAPLIGSKAAAEKAQLIVLVGGPPAAREQAGPALHAVSARLIEFDEPAQAELMKLVVNVVGCAMMAGFAEALTLGASGGLEMDRVIDAIQASSFHSPFYLIKGEQILQRDWEPRFPMALADKDERLALEAAADQGAKLPVSAAVHELFGQVTQSGRGGQDLASVADLLLEWAKVAR